MPSKKILKNKSRLKSKRNRKNKSKCNCKMPFFKWGGDDTVDDNKNVQNNREYLLNAMNKLNTPPNLKNWQSMQVPKNGITIGGNDGDNDGIIKTIQDVANTATKTVVDDAKEATNTVANSVTNFSNDTISTLNDTGAHIQNVSSDVLDNTKDTATDFFGNTKKVLTDFTSSTKNAIHNATAEDGGIPSKPVCPPCTPPITPPDTAPPTPINTPPVTPPDSPYSNSKNYAVNKLRRQNAMSNLNVDENNVGGRKKKYTKRHSSKKHNKKTKKSKKTKKHRKHNLRGGCTDCGGLKSPEYSTLANNAQPISGIASAQPNGIYGQTPYPVWQYSK
jgi:hypothetical protein